MRYQFMAIGMLALLVATIAGHGLRMPGRTRAVRRSRRLIAPMPGKGADAL